MKQRILELSHRHKLSHIGSNLTTADVLETLPDNAFVVLSCGHAGLALYCWLEMRGLIDAERMLMESTQPHLSIGYGIHCSSGSLGQGLTVAVGYAMAMEEDVHCIISDGECAEGCVWEALAFTYRQGLSNLHIHVNMNGYSAMSAIDQENLEMRLKAFLPSIHIHRTNVHQYPFLRGINAHYCSMTDADYAETIH